VRLKSRETQVVVALGLLLGVVAVSSPQFFKPAPLLSLLAREAPGLVATLGVAWVMIARQIDISIGSLFSLCGVAAGLLAAAGVPAPVVLFAAAGLGAVLGACNGFFVAVVGLPSIVVTLGAMVAWRDALRWWRQGQFVNLPDGVQWFGLPQTTGQLAVLGFALALAGVMTFLSRRIAGGRHVYAVGSDAEAARVTGLPVKTVQSGAFVAAGLLSGLGAMLNLVESPAVDPKAGLGLELKAVAACVVGGVAIAGGRGSFPGVLAGYALLGLLGPALTYLHVQAYWEKAIHGVVILVAAAAEGRRRLAPRRS
jgi:rhamnose transport system permease protein